jgi:hypothetical protein
MTGMSGTWRMAVVGVVEMSFMVPYCNDLLVLGETTDGHQDSVMSATPSSP